MSIAAVPTDHPLGRIAVIIPVAKQTVEISIDDARGLVEQLKTAIRHLEDYPPKMDPKAPFWRGRK